MQRARKRNVTFSLVQYSTMSLFFAPFLFSGHGAMKFDPPEFAMFTAIRLFMGEEEWRRRGVGTSHASWGRDRHGHLPLLLTSGGHHQKPVQTCSLQDPPPTGNDI